MGLTVVTPASSAAWPVTLAEIKQICRVEDTSMDTELGLIQASAVATAERLLGRPVAPTLYKLTLDQFSDAIELPKGPVTSVDWVKYVSPGNVLTTIDQANYSLDLTSRPQWVVRNSDYDWPVTMDAVNVVTIQFTAGFTTSTIPGDVKAGVLALAKHWYENGLDAAITPGLENMFFADRDFGF